MTQFTELQLPEGTRKAAEAMARPEDQWLTIFREQTDGSPTAIAARIMGDLWGYGTRTKGDRYRNQDIISLANALKAYEAWVNGDAR